MLGYPSNSDTFQIGHFSNWKLQRGQWESWSPCELIFVCKYLTEYIAVETYFLMHQPVTLKPFLHN